MSLNVVAHLIETDTTMISNRYFSSHVVIAAFLNLMGFMLLHSIVVAQLDSALNFFPLHSGDVHQFRFHGSNSSGFPCTTRTWQSYHLEEILGDTILPTGYQYKIIASTVPEDPRIRYLRVDTSSANVYMYADYPSPSEVLVDSLMATIGSSFVKDGWVRTECIGIDTATILGIHTIIKRFHMNYIYGEDYSFALGFGRIQQITYADDACYPILNWFYRDLVYAKIGSQEFGTLVNVHDFNQDLPGSFSLNQNYPNPFNPITIIRYQVPYKSSVQLRIYNLLGQTIAKLVDEIQEPGYKSIEFDATGFSSGIYFYHLQAGSFNQVKKLILLK